MNFLAATRSPDGATARVGDGAFRLDPADAALWRGAGGGPLTVGVRPEHFVVAAADGADAAGGGASAADGLPGRVEFAEALGAETLLHVETAAGRVVVRGAPGAARGAAGNHVRLVPAPGALRLFDDAGRSLGAVHAPAAP